MIKLAEEAFFPWYDHRVSAFADRLRAVCMVLAPVKDNVKHIAGSLSIVSSIMLKGLTGLRTPASEIVYECAELSSSSILLIRIDTHATLRAVDSDSALYIFVR